MPAFASDRFSVGTGFDYSSGKYGNPDATQILYVPVIGQYETDSWTLKLTVPYLRVTSPGGVIKGFGRITSSSNTGGPRFGRTASGTSSNSGLGDVVASADYAFYSAGPFSLDVVGKIKFGTASADLGLGTGEDDYSAQIDGYYSLVSNTSLFATAGYKLVGAPSGVSVNNVAFGTVGSEVKLSDTARVGVMFDFEQKVAAAGSNQEEATLYATQELSKNLKLQESLSKGFSDGSPDYSIGVTLKHYF